jgi:hypothetical protein
MALGNGANEAAAMEDPELSAPGTPAFLLDGLIIT